MRNPVVCISHMAPNFQNHIPKICGPILTKSYFSVFALQVCKTVLNFVFAVFTLYVADTLLSSAFGNPSSAMFALHVHTYCRILCMQFYIACFLYLTESFICCFCIACYFHLVETLHSCFSFTHGWCLRISYFFYFFIACCLHLAESCFYNF